MSAVRRCRRLRAISPKTGTNHVREHAENDDGPDTLTGRLAVLEDRIERLEDGFTSSDRETNRHIVDDRLAAIEDDISSLREAIEALEDQVDSLEGWADYSLRDVQAAIDKVATDSNALSPEAAAKLDTLWHAIRQSEDELSLDSSLDLDHMLQNRLQ